MPSRVTAPRRIPATKTTFAVCRRVQGRQFLLRPDARFTALVTWLLAACAALFEVELHVAVVMSSHPHLVLSVADQRVSDFMARFDANLAKAVKVLRRLGRGIVWEPGGLSIVELKTADAMVHAIAYAIANPVAAGLVWRPEDWPGLTARAEDLGRAALRGVRPDYYFRPARWAADASIRLTLPAVLLEELGEDEARRRIAAEVERLVAEAHADLRARRVRVLGPIAAKTASPFARATSRETYGALRPHVATGPGRVEERIAAKLELVGFRRAYRESWLRFAAGERDVVFPCGTLLMRVRFGVRVAPS